MIRSCRRFPFFCCLVLVPARFPQPKSTPLPATIGTGAAISRLHHVLVQRYQQRSGLLARDQAHAAVCDDQDVFPVRAVAKLVRDMIRASASWQYPHPYPPPPGPSFPHSCKEMDWVNFITVTAVDEVLKHIRFFRLAQSGAEASERAARRSNGEVGPSAHSAYTVPFHTTPPPRPPVSMITHFPSPLPPSCSAAAQPMTPSSRPRPSSLT